MCTEFWWGYLRERDSSEDPGLDGRIILRWIFRTWDEKVSTGFICLTIWIGSCKRSNKLSAFIKCGEFLD